MAPVPVDLWSCLQGTIQFRISDCEAGGLVYILNRGFVYNVQPSQNGTMIYTCSFDDCSVYWVTHQQMLISK
ncbi:hypothetical protein DPMN_043983 [Dreissena polymorpha]|uniref:Uncharacterized protein n=1 Tax=Dreissena polymorpha TaxID=45954 RepID=A0A9D4D3S3_DREPO|nr:hypothetical protein DPMN_043983 [Dreissena polymorpha]